MKSPVTAIEVRWRHVGDTAWQSRSYVPGAKIQIREIERGGQYEVEARSIGVPGVEPSEWVPATVEVPTTNRTGALALPTNVVGNQASMWNVGTSVTYSAESPTSGDSEATISVSAATLIVGGKTISYGPSSATVTGAPDSSRDVYLYYDDLQWQGGSRPLGVADNIVDSANVNGRIAITKLTLNFPSPGTSGGGGGDAGGGGGGGGAHEAPR